MPVELQIIRASEFVRVNAKEQLDFEASKEALQLLARACCKRGLDRALLDLRSVPVPSRPHFTAKELAALVRAFRDGGFTSRQRLAILYRQDVHGGVKTFALISRLKGIQVQAFNEFECALEWLSTGDQGPRTEPGIEIPIRVAGNRRTKKKQAARTSQPESVRLTRRSKR